ncbi:MAG: tripartite tricarboxylate transporter substrate binding protein [Rhodovarius sp.]|nr:tripartite tricarboxylate transporter substrate binding protein [Rhodovarius sp.]MDW8315012.1 tripartite tricarboxylate transporter substrate binding protein [Rhodovarius sp.]
MNRRSLLVGAAAAGLAAPALAQSGWPNRPVRVIVPFPPGGSTDGMARVTAGKLQEKLGQPFIVENRAGANGAVGGRAVAAAPPDGYTLLFSASIQAMARLVMRDPGYDPLTDLTPIIRVGQGPLLLVMNPARGPNNLQELVAAVRANPTAWNIATSSLGAAGHLASIELIRLIGREVTVVPYRGTNPALTDVIANNAAMMFDPVLATLPPVRAGTLRGLCITSTQRSEAAPQIPTAAEQGLPSLDIQSWWGLWGPRGFPAEVIARIGEVLRVGMFEPDITPRVGALGVIPLAEVGADFARFIQQDFERSQQLLRLANFQPE